MTRGFSVVGTRLLLQANLHGTSINSVAEILAASVDTADGVRVALGPSNSILLDDMPESSLTSANCSFFGQPAFEIPDIPVVI